MVIYLLSYKIIDSYVTAIVQYYTTLSFDAQHINIYLRNKNTTKRLKNRIRIYSKTFLLFFLYFSETSGADHKINDF